LYPVGMTRINDVLTITEAAAVKGCSADAIRIAIREGRLKADQRNKRLYLIHRRDLDNWTVIGHRPKKERRAARARQEEQE
jgi:excisionase family DNA binding protein